MNCRNGFFKELDILMVNDESGLEFDLQDAMYFLESWMLGILG